VDTQTFFGRGVAQAVVREELAPGLENSNSSRPLRIKFGVDPSSPHLTLGHVVCFRKLRQLQQMGHRVVVVIGDWTARIGDPSGRSKSRQMLDPAIVRGNAGSYLEQFFRFVDERQTEVRFQSEWFGDFGLDDVIRLTGRFTVAQMLARDDFRTRFEAGRPISMAEFLYALLQAFDSVALRADIELGGNDQLFNVLVGRTIMKEYGLVPQHIITVPILVGTDGVEKMGKSTGNFIPVTASPDEMFGALMSLPDTAMTDYFILLTDVPEALVRRFEQEMAAGLVNPRDVKLRMAREIVGSLYDVRTARQAEKSFVRVFSEQKAPQEMPVHVLRGKTKLVDLMVEAGLCRSKSEARRLVEQGGVRLDGRRVQDFGQELALAAPQEAILRVGRRRFLRLRPDLETREDEHNDDIEG
jgi:tyrosyl-tRNA synthetase